MGKIVDPGYQLSNPSELEACAAKVQSVKKSFLRRFWLSAGRQVVRDTARQRLEEVRVLPFGFALFMC